VIVDCAVYQSGERQGERLPLERVGDEARRGGDRFVWIGLHEPDEAELAEVARHLPLHPLALEDAHHAHQRPKVEVYADLLFVVLKAAHYVDSEEIVEINEIMLFLGDGFVVTVRHGTSGLLGDVRADLAQMPGDVGFGPLGILHAVVDRVVDHYADVVAGLEVDIDEIEKQVFSGEMGNHAPRIYRVKREVLDFRQAVVPLADALEHLLERRVPLPEHIPFEYFRDVHDHVLRVGDRVQTLDSLLDSALSANLAQASVRQNEDMRKISAWVAIVAVPTMIAGIYGMNFDNMPELDERYGYYIVLGVMAAISGSLYLLFRRRGWL
jgi:magnesium transporter